MPPAWPGCDHYRTLHPHPTFRPRPYPCPHLILALTPALHRTPAPPPFIRHLKLTGPIGVRRFSESGLKGARGFPKHDDGCAARLLPEQYVCTAGAVADFVLARAIS
jgi:hypothetical protein